MSWIHLHLPHSNSTPPALALNESQALGYPETLWRQAQKGLFRQGSSWSLAPSPLPLPSFVSLFNFAISLDGRKFERKMWPDRKEWGKRSKRQMGYVARDKRRGRWKDAPGGRGQREWQWVFCRLRSWKELARGFLTRQRKPNSFALFYGFRLFQSVRHSGQLKPGGYQHLMHARGVVPDLQEKNPMESQFLVMGTVPFCSIQSRLL